MKKALVIIVAVAILGALGLFANSKNTGNPSNSQQADVSGTATTSSNQTATQTTSTTGTYKDGSYTKSADTPYGPVKITVVLSGGQITDVQFDDMPNDEERSAEITAFSSAKLRQSAIDAQSASIDFVSGATSTSYGFKESLQAALDAAAQT